MRTTASFDLFPEPPGERLMARARWLAREGRANDAAAAYRSVLAERPDLKTCWAEYFELLRRSGRAEEALHLSDACSAQFQDAAFPLALRGAALTELGRFREALGALEQAVERDPDLGLVWHELGYAAYRLNDRNRALLALDRAFALEPHSETLNLRGRILRDAGRYQAAEVAFEGAAQAAEHQEQRELAEREIAVTRRFASYSPRKPDELALGARWFGETGSVVLTDGTAAASPQDGALVEAFADLAQDAGWRFTHVVAIGGDRGGPAWRRLRDLLSAEPADGVSSEGCALVASVRPEPADAAWARAIAAVVERGTGMIFSLEHPAEGPALVDVAGAFTDGGRRRAGARRDAHALSEAQHPDTRWAGRRPRPA